MKTDLPKNPVKMPQPTAPDLVVALFKDVKYAHGALADLASMGIPGDRIAVAFSAEGEKMMRPQFDVVHPGRGNEEYPLAWRLRHGFTRNLHHRSGADDTGHHAIELVAGRDVTAPESSDENPYTIVNLHDTLRGISAAEDRILLLDRALGRNGVLILVEAEDRSREVQSLLENDCGQIRTDSVTERREEAVRIPPTE